MPRPAAPLLAIALLVAVWGAGCGGSSATDSTPTTGGSAEQAPGAGAPAGATAQSCDSYAGDAKALRATAIPCGQARQVMYSWQRQPSCALPAGASRGSCLTHSYHCQAVRADRGVAISCARAGASIAFIARRR